MRAELISRAVAQGRRPRSTKDGDGYQKARQAFGVLLGNHGQAMYFASRYVGGVYVNRATRETPTRSRRSSWSTPAKQREALALLEEQVFSDKPFQFPPELYNHLASHALDPLGHRDMPLRTDYPVHEVIAHVAGPHPVSNCSRR